MSGAFSKPILVSSGGVSFPAKIPLTSPGVTEYSESWLQDLLYRFPEALPIDEIDDSFSGLIPLCREMNTPAGPVDVVYITPTGKPVIIEAKLWRNPEARRKVIGQILDYAKEISQWSVEEFDARVRDARRAEDGSERKGILDLVRQKNSNVEEAKFFDTVARSLARGDLLLLIVGDGIREGAGSIAQFLEKHGSLHFTFGLVEMAIHQMADGSKLILPRVLAQSAIIRRFVVQLDSPGLVVKDDTQDEEENEVLYETRERYATFWTELLQNLDLDDKSQAIPRPTTSTNQFFYMAPGTDSWLCARLLQSMGTIGVYLRFNRGPVGNRIYERLLEKRNDIDDALGIKVDWDSNDKRHRIIAIEAFPGRIIEDHAQEAQDWFADRINRFVNVFKPRIERLAASAGLTASQ